MNTVSYLFRDTPRREDVECVENIVRATGFFREDEISVAVELIRERLENGERSGYEFLFAEEGGKVIAYACYGQIPCTLHSYDLYWIVCHPAFMNRGIGRSLLQKTEEILRKREGKGLYVETSSTDKYFPTRKFYEKCGYLLKARFEDFYSPGDDKMVYVKYL